MRLGRVILVVIWAILAARLMNYHEASAASLTFKPTAATDSASKTDWHHDANGELEKLVQLDALAKTILGHQGQPANFTRLGGDPQSPVTSVPTPTAFGMGGFLLGGAYYLRARRRRRYQ